MPAMPAPTITTSNFFTDYDNFYTVKSFYPFKLASMKKNRSYWTINVTVISILLVIWFLISLGFGIMFSDAMDTYRLGGFKLGFWFAQQGSIIGFVIIIFLYAGIMNRVDKKFSKKDK